MKNWYKKYSQSGEWWILDGRALFADGDIGDTNHSGQVIDYILSIHDLSPETFDLTKENEQTLKAKGFDVDEINALLDKVDPREYGLVHLGWKRVHGNNVQTQNLTSSDLEDIANGLWDAYESDLENNENITFNIEVMSSGKFFVRIPYKIISDGNVLSLIHYKEMSMASGTNWYKRAADDLASYFSTISAFWILPNGEMAKVPFGGHNEYVMYNMSRFGTTPEEAGKMVDDNIASNDYEVAFLKGAVRMDIVGSRKESNICGKKQFIRKFAFKISDMLKKNGINKIIVEIFDEKNKTNVYSTKIYRSPKAPDEFLRDFL